MTKNTTTVTGKTSKKGLIDYLTNAQQTVTDENMLTRIGYTLKKVAEDAKAVMREDLFELAKDVLVYVTPVQVTLPMESALKVVKEVPVEDAPVAEEETVPMPTEAPPVAKKAPVVKKKVNPEVASKTSEELARDILGTDADDTSEVKEKKVAGKSKKPVVKKVEKEAPVVKKAPAVVSDEDTNAKKIILAKQFPETLKTDLGTLKANMEINTIEELYKAINAGREFVIACYWTKRHLKQFTYDEFGISKTKWKEFPNDLDLTKPLYVGENHTIVYCLSVYSEVMYAIKHKDMEMTDEGMRFSTGMEFNLYEVIAE